MAEQNVLKLHNEAGVSIIKTGARRFKCTGALPPLDHPHVFLEMGCNDEIICQYCSTIYKYDPNLPDNMASPKECILQE